MLPSRGLRPAHFVPLASRQSLYIRPNAVRQFSSAPRTPTLSALSQRSSPLRSANWRTGASGLPSSPLNASAVRYGSWYAPWSWGKSNTPSPTAPSDLSGIRQTPVPEPVVTTATPELAPAGIDKPAVVDTLTPGASQPVHKSVEELVEGVIRDQPEVVKETMVNPHTAIDHFGALKELGLDYGIGPTALFEWLIEHVYVMSGLGWGTSILASVLVIRTGLFWVNMKSSNNMAKMASVTPLVRDIDIRMREAIKNGETAQSAVFRSEMQKVYKDVGVNPLASLPPIAVQIGMGFGAWRCLRGMADLPVPGLSQGGWLWFQDLTIADPYYILPATAAGLTYAVMKLGGETGTANQTQLPGAQMAMQVGLPILMFFFCLGWPAGLQIYMIATSILGAITAMILKKPSFRQFAKLAPLPSKESQEMWKKVAKGEISLDKVIGPDGQLRAFPSGSTAPKYQAPSKSNRAGTSSKFRSSTIQHRGLTLKAGTALPAHLQPPVDKTHISNKELQDRDYDFDNVPSGTMAKLDWFGRNFKPVFLLNRFRLWLASMTNNPKVRARLLQTKKDREREKRVEYEARRRSKL